MEETKKPAAAIKPPRAAVLAGPSLAMRLPPVIMPRLKKTMMKLKVRAVSCRAQPKLVSRGPMKMEKA